MDFRALFEKLCSSWKQPVSPTPKLASAMVSHSRPSPKRLRRSENVSEPELTKEEKEIKDVIIKKMSGLFFSKMDKIVNGASQMILRGDAERFARDVNSDTNRAIVRSVDRIFDITKAAKRTDNLDPTAGAALSGFTYVCALIQLAAQHMGNCVSLSSDPDCGHDKKTRLLNEAEITEFIRLLMVVFEQDMLRYVKQSRGTVGLYSSELMMEESPREFI